MGGRAYAAVARATLAQARGDYPAMQRALREFDDPAVHELIDGLGSPGLAGAATAATALLLDLVVAAGR